MSYYDGSPLIAYLIKLATLCFGDTLLALNCLAISMTALTALVIYKTARLFLDKKASLIALLLWLFSPLVTLDLLNQVTLNTPLSLFWALTLYYTIRYLITPTTPSLYNIGINIGLMMLSKYSGVVLVFALLLFILQKPYRSLFKSYPIYDSILLAVIFFSPVLLWNYQHDWISFTYQLGAHAHTEAMHPFYSAWHTLLTHFSISLNFMFIPPIVYCLGRVTNNKWFKLNHKNLNRNASQPAKLCFVVCTVFFIFYLMISGVAGLRSVWLEQYLITGCLLAGYIYQGGRYHQGTHILIGVYILISFCMLVTESALWTKTPSKKRTYYEWIQKFNATNPSKHYDAVISSGWFEARMLFFLNGAPLVYTLDCGSLQNQYAYWSKEMVEQIHQKKISHALYLDIQDRRSCIQAYFDRCEPLKNAFDTTEKPLVFALDCYNDMPKLQNQE